MNKTITKEKVFNYPIDQIWNAITKAEEISTWFLKTDFKAEKDYQYTFRSKPNDIGCREINGIVKEANPYTLVYTWIVSGTNIITTVTWKLETVAKGTKLYLEHSGIENYAGETVITMFESFNGGWESCVNALTKYLKEEVNAR